MQLTLNVSQLSTITHALSVAAERFNENARIIRDSNAGLSSARFASIAVTFDNQAREARELLIAITEQCG